MMALITYTLYKVLGFANKKNAVRSVTVTVKPTQGDAEFTFDIEEISWKKIHIKLRKPNCTLYNTSTSEGVSEGSKITNDLDLGVVELYTVNSGAKITGVDNEGHQFETSISGDETTVYSADERGVFSYPKYRVSGL